MLNRIAALHTVKQYGKMQCQICISEVIDIAAVLLECLMQDIMNLLHIQIREYILQCL